MTDADQVSQALAELWDIVKCRCHEAYTGRGLHDPDCQCDSTDAVQTVADRIEALTAKLDDLQDRLDVANKARAHVMKMAVKKQAKLVKAVEGLDKAAALIEDRHVVHMTSKGRNPKDYISDWSLIAKEVRALLAEIEGEKT